MASNYVTYSLYRFFVRSDGKWDFNKVMKCCSLLIISCVLSGPYPCNVITQYIHSNREHSFPRNAEFWAESQNLPVSAEFLCFHGIRHWAVIRGQIRHIFVVFRRPQKI